MRPPPSKKIRILKQYSPLLLLVYPRCLFYVSGLMTFAGERNRPSHLKFRTDTLSTDNIRSLFGDWLAVGGGDLQIYNKNIL